MKSNIVKEAKAEVAAKAKTEKPVKSYTIMQIVKAIVVIVALTCAGAYAGITIDRAITNNIDNQVKSQVVEQVRNFTAEQK